MSEQDARARAIAEQARQIANRWWRSRDASPDAEAPESLAEAIAVALSATADTARETLTHDRVLRTIQNWWARLPMTIDKRAKQVHFGDCEHLLGLLISPVSVPDAQEKQLREIVAARERGEDWLTILRNLSATADTARAQAFEGIDEIIRLLGRVRPLDIGAHYCRYCPAKSPAWEHTPACPYLESGRDYADAKAMIAKLRARATAGDTP